MIRVGIIGTASFTGGELIRLLGNHPEVKLTFLESSSQAGLKLAQVHHHLQGVVDLELQKYDSTKIVENCDLIFICRSSGGSMKFVRELYSLSADIKIIDLGGDFRLQDPILYPQWYKFEHTAPELLKEAVLGLSELYTDKIKSARLVSNPGCYATSIILALTPLLAKKSIEPNSIRITAYSGMSGAGKTYKEGFNLFMDMYGNAHAYRVGNHQHTPEIEQVLSEFAEEKIITTFIPHVLPIDRGILATIWAKPKHGFAIDDFYDIFNSFYGNKPFIRIREKGDYPQIMDVIYTNFCDLGLELDKRTNSLIIFSAEDNAIKGASGQAIQNMNLMCGFPETLGLPFGNTLK